MNLKAEIKKAAREDRVVVGANESVKKSESISKIVLADNAPVELVSRVREEAGSADMVEFDGNNEELGSVCGKPFSASVIGVKEV